MYYFLNSLRVARFFRLFCLPFIQSYIKSTAWSNVQKNLVADGSVTITSLPARNKSLHLHKDILDFHFLINRTTQKPAIVLLDLINTLNNAILNDRKLKSQIENGLLNTTPKLKSAKMQKINSKRNVQKTV